MLTTAITGAITAVLAFFGIPPGPYVAGIWIGVKIAIVGGVFLVGVRMARKRRARAAAGLAVATVSPADGEQQASAQAAADGDRTAGG
jgi:chromate transport protein ChrA